MLTWKIVIALKYVFDQELIIQQKKLTLITFLNFQLT